MTMRHHFPPLLEPLSFYNLFVRCRIIPEYALYARRLPFLMQTFKKIKTINDKGKKEKAAIRK